MDIKQKLFEALQGLGIDVIDNPFDRVVRDRFPFLLFRTNNLMTKQKNMLKETTYTFLLDIYSDYQGEKEIYEIYGKIIEILNVLYQDPTVVRVADNGIKIIDDKTLGPIMKHGIMNVSIKTAVKGE